MLGWFTKGWKEERVRRLEESRLAFLVGNWSLYLCFLASFSSPFTGHVGVQLMAFFKGVSKKIIMLNICRCSVWAVHEAAKDWAIARITSPRTFIFVP